MTDKNEISTNEGAVETDDRELDFTCPECGGNRLFLRQEALLEVQAVHADGDVEYDDAYPRQGPRLRV